MMNKKPLAVARACLQAYIDRDRAAIEALLDDDFHFTSPIDNDLDRVTYLKSANRYNTHNCRISSSPTNSSAGRKQSTWSYGRHVGHVNRKTFKSPHRPLPVN